MKNNHKSFNSEIHKKWVSIGLIKPTPSKKTFHVNKAGYISGSGFDVLTDSDFNILTDLDLNVLTGT